MTEYKMWILLGFSIKQSSSLAQEWMEWIYYPVCIRCKRANQCNCKVGVNSVSLSCKPSKQFEDTCLGSVEPFHCTVPGHIILVINANTFVLGCMPVLRWTSGAVVWFFMLCCVERLDLHFLSFGYDTRHDCL